MLRLVAGREDNAMCKDVQREKEEELRKVLERAEQQVGSEEEEGKETKGEEEDLLPDSEDEEGKHSFDWLAAQVGVAWSSGRNPCTATINIMIILECCMYTV